MLNIGSLIEGSIRNTTMFRDGKLVDFAVNDQFTGVPAVACRVFPEAPLDSTVTFALGHDSEVHSSEAGPLFWLCSVLLSSTGGLPADIFGDSIDFVCDPLHPP